MQVFPFKDKSKNNTIQVSFGGGGGGGGGRGNAYFLDVPGLLRMLALCIKENTGMWY